ncbi:MAG: hypothetical protein HN817_01200 [Porticoccaceae bacterium]|nr:hypothetical protein [Porticoccaceae bacterium]MBT5577721.1 hypothetical protein [Porticoccaceae bacterium]MBT7374530.1 hypothetical protein [Porticoccaceae bacterium]
MKRVNTIFALALCLIIGLGSVTASAHTHNDHQESSCSVSVLQHSSAALATDNETTYPSETKLPKPNQHVQAVSDPSKGCQLARAPPFSL